MPFENPWNNLPKAEFVYDTLTTPNHSSVLRALVQDLHYEH